MSYMKDTELRVSSIETSMEVKLNKIAGGLTSNSRFGDVQTKLGRINKTRTHKDNIEKVLEFDQECKHNGHKPCTRYSALMTLHNLCQYAGSRRFKDLNKTDVIKYLDMAQHRGFEDTRHRARTGKVEKELAESSMNHVKYQVKRFFRWLYGMRKGEYPDMVSWIEIKLTNRIQEIDPEQLPTAGELKRLIECADKPRDRALISLMAESGLRCSELSLLQLKDISWNENGFTLTVHEKKSKSRFTRRIPLCACAEDLKNYINNFHPYASDPDSPVFISYINNSTPRSNLKRASIEAITSRIAKDSGVSKRIHIYPHLLRHTRASQLAELGWNEPMLRQFFGWEKSSKMPSIYIHMSQKSLQDRYYQMYGLAPAEDEKTTILESPKSCDKCGTKNPNGYRFCFRCNTQLDKENQHIAVQKKETEAVMNYIATNENLSRKFSTLVKEAYEALARDDKES